MAGGWGSASTMNDRVFAISFGASLGLHLILLLGQILSLPWWDTPRPMRPIEVVYEYEIVQQELKELQERHSKAARDLTTAPASAPGLSERTQIRIPDRPSLTVEQTVADLALNRSSVIDLTNLVDASRGDPVLLSYFGAIREQIQQAANHRPWLTGETAQGLVYVSFILSSSGAVQGISIVADRSVSSDQLRDVAVKIVKTAAPFLPFPPSMTDPQKTIVVPLEFLLGS
ncbi:MAG: hypothetical protein COV75_01810 [Candidatus Omnitrophica bacterium CG11_big_fil_rev_8_21_14_0_20_63_9]|nr:MAG: hypothetical protein COV75_01810 [Candidatus Omnitrophica bacterium CG11_big_fil_rev_8_21_14_0_20_63_9]